MIEFDFPFLEFMVLHMITFYRPQIAQVNEELFRESSLDLTLTKHPCDKDPKPRKVHPRLEVEPPQVGIIAFLRTSAPW